MLRLSRGFGKREKFAAVHRDKNVAQARFDRNGFSFPAAQVPSYAENSLANPKTRCRCRSSALRFVLQKEHSVVACNKRKASAQGSKARSNPSIPVQGKWIASLRSQ